MSHPHMKPIICERFEAENLEGRVELRCRVRSDGLPEELRFQVSPEAEPDAGEPNWAAVALLYPAMFLGRDLELDAGISGRLLHALQNDVQDVLILNNPAIRRVRVSAGISRTFRTPAGSAATGFSAGVDSFATVKMYKSAPCPLTLSHLTVFNVGAFGHTAKVASEFRQSADRLRSFADNSGLEAFEVDSNLDDFFRAATISDKRVGFQQTHTVRNAAAALTLQNALGTYFYSSAVPYEQISLAPHDSTAFVDPVLLPLLSTNDLRFLSGAAGLSRVEKTKLIASDPQAQTMLDVCVAPPKVQRGLDRPNCSMCWKCARTQLTLEALGCLEKFSEVFYLDRYHENRDSLVRDIVERAASGEALNNDREALDLAVQAGLSIPRLPLRSRARRRARRTLRTLRGMAVASKGA